MFANALEAVKDIRDGSTVLIGGFGCAGVPESLCLALSQTKVRNLTLVSNDCGLVDFGLGLLVNNHQVKRITCSYLGENHDVEHKFLNGEIEIELVPQGTLIEKCRAGGAGIPAFYTRTGVDTMVETGGIPIKLGKYGWPTLMSTKKTRAHFDGKTYIRESAIVGDVAFVKAWKADEAGNLIFRKAARNFNPNLAESARLCIAEVDEILPLGSIDPDHVHLPGVYVKRLVKAEVNEHKIEKLTITDLQSKCNGSSVSAVREKIAKRAA